MKMKRFIFLVISMFLLSVRFVYAETDKVYLTLENMYYQRSQHTYSFTNSKGEYHNEYAPAIFVLLDDQELANSTEEWDFVTKYDVPFKKDTDYYLAICVDLDVMIKEGTVYNKVFVDDSNYFQGDVKNHVVGIIKNSYPFVSYDDMVNSLVEKNILEKRILSDGTEIVTAVGNGDVDRSITSDELLSAVQMALFNFTNSGEIEDKYYYTYKLHTSTIVDNKIDSNGYSYGYYDTVKNNIEAVYNYLITLESDSGVNKINSVEYQKANDKYYLGVTLSKDIKDVDNYSIEITNSSGYSKNIELQNELKDGKKRYIIKLDDITDVTGLKVKLVGRELSLERVDVYEPVDGKESSQTLIGVSEGYVDVNQEYMGEMLDSSDLVEENPNTLDGILIATILFAITFVIWKFILPGVKPKRYNLS